MNELLRRLRERRVGQWAVVYLAAAWVCLEALGFVADTFGWPSVVVRSAILVAATGLLAVLVLAWYHGDKGRQRATGAELLILAGVFILGAALIATFGRGGREAERPREVYAPAWLADGPSVAVLPFQVRGPDMELWREGLVDLLSINLDGPALRAIDSRTVLARWTERVPDGVEADLETALEVARATGARHAVLGTAVAAGQAVRLAADVRGLQGGELERQVRVDGPADSMISLVDRLSLELLRSLLAEEEVAPRADLASVTTGSIDALKAFLEGEQHYRRGEYEAADRAYNRGVAADSGFALAYYRLGLTRGWTEAAGTETVREPLERAVALASGLPLREAGLARAALAVAASDAGGIDSAEALAARYPDDPEAWYLLGELYYHHGVRRLVGWEETESALLRAVELDPGWAPHYLHLVDLAFLYHADSATAAARIARYRSLAPESRWTRTFDRLFALGFGDPAARAAVLKELETVEFWDLGILDDRLMHPSFWPQLESVLLLVRRRGSAEEQLGAVYNLYYGSALARGHVARALRVLEDPLAPVDLKTCGLLSTEAGLGAVPQEVLDAALSREAVERRLAEGGDRPQDVVPSLVCGALYAAGMGRAEDAQILRGRLVAFAERAAAAGDAALAGDLQVLVRSADGLSHWVAGDAQAAYALLSDVPEFHRVVGRSEIWWGQILIDVGRPAEAIPYLLALRSDPLAHLYLGEAYEATGEYARARAAYEYFLSWWSDADPAFRPLLEDARAGLTRIAPLLD